jgi:hypothetical protein
LRLLYRSRRLGAAGSPDQAASLAGHRTFRVERVAFEAKRALAHADEPRG